MSYDLENLSMENLLALALRDNASVKELAASYSSPRKLNCASLSDLTQIKGIGKRKALQVLAVLELSKRIVSCPPNDSPIITMPSDLFHVIKDRVKLLDKEHFFVFCTDNKNRIISTETVSVGSLNQTVVHPREIFKRAIKLNAASILLCHNHVSGCCTPSNPDIEVTKRLVNAGEIVGINVLDHLVVSGDSYYSFKEKGLM